MSSNNIIKISAAGAGKTWDICHDALSAVEHGGQKVLITTYTNRGAESIRREIRKQNDGVLSPNVVIKTWYEFLLSECIRPYQSALKGVAINEIRSFDFSQMYERVNYAKTGTKPRYLTTQADVRANEASNLSLLLNQLSGNRVIQRIEQIYGMIYFDEVQDLCGADIDLIKLLIDSKVGIVCCGDHKQATYSTHNTQKNKKLTGTNIWVFFEKLSQQGKVEIERKLITRRFNKQICSFANAVFPIGDPITTSMHETTEHDGVYIIIKKDVERYIERYQPQVLRYDVKTDALGYRAVNFGACKGETFDRVLIFPNGPFEQYLLKQKSFASPEKYYVAVTRPRHSLAFVLDTLPAKVQSFEKDTIRLGEEEITCYKYLAGEQMSDANKE